MHFYREFACHYDSCQRCGRPRGHAFNLHQDGHCYGDCLEVALLFSGRNPLLWRQFGCHSPVETNNDTTGGASGPTLPDHEGPNTHSKET